MYYGNIFRSLKVINVCSQVAVKSLTKRQGSYYFRDAKWQNNFPSEKSTDKKKAGQQIFTLYFMLLISDERCLSRLELIYLGNCQIAQPGLFHSSKSLKQFNILVIYITNPMFQLKLLHFLLHWHKKMRSKMGRNEWISFHELALKISASKQAWSATFMSLLNFSFHELSLWSRELTFLLFSPTTI